MKTDEEMIESLFRRRDEYYRKTAKKNTLFAAFKVIGGISLPIAAAGAVALLMISAQKNTITDDIGGDVTEVPKSDTAASDIYNGENSPYPSEQGTEMMNISCESAPLCFSFDGTIYKYDDETFESEKYRFTKDNLTESGTAVVLDTRLDAERCTVYDLEDSDRKAVITDNDEICLYKAVGSSSHTVEGIEFEIKALHRTAKNCQASMLPLFKEGEDVVFRAYDKSGNPVNDTFILYTPTLTEVSDNALWEVSTKYFYEPTYSTPINLISYSQMTYLCAMIWMGRLNADDFIEAVGYNSENVVIDYEHGIPDYYTDFYFTDIVVNDEHIATGIQIYYTDFYRTEYVLEAYDNSDEIALTRIATGERILITDQGADYLDFLLSFVPYQDEYTDTAEKVSRLLDMYLVNTLTVKELNCAGFEVSETYHDRYEIFYTENGKERAAAAFMDENGNLSRFVVLDADVYNERYYDYMMEFEYNLVKN